MVRWSARPEPVPAGVAAVATPAAPAPVTKPARPRARLEQDAGLEAAAQQAGVLAQASREVAETSRQAAESLTELRAAIGDISESTGRASSVAEEAARDAEAVDARIAALHDASEAITEIAQLISTISQQSRFLALNAYVEAARAGEVGRGFAVVADEVKQLAERTARAAEDIGSQIDAVQQETRHAVAAIQRISGTLTSIADAQDAISAAVEQQRAATDRVVENVDRAASGSARITDAVAELAGSQRLIYVRRALAFSEEMLEEAGGMELGERLLTATVKDHLTGATHTTQLPEVLIGGVPLHPMDDPRRPSALVDGVIAQVGGSCTLFQRLDGEGSMVRVATTVVNDTGKRNVNTYINRWNADGTPNPVLAAVLGGQPYIGPSTVAGRPYYTAYAGVQSSSGELIGMIYVGLPAEDLA